MLDPRRSTRGRLAAWQLSEMHLTVVAITIEPIPASANPRPTKARPGLTSQSAADEAGRALGIPVINLRATGRFLPVMVTFDFAQI